MNTISFSDDNLNRLIEDLGKQQTQILNEISTQNQEEDKTKSLTKEMSFIQSLTLTAVKYRNYRKQMKLKIT
jgi:hypothetical protein|tara:strand:- start:2 stop:217 length:216 start_codon:yes stop_codon:yes gene_type:complete